MLEATCHCGAVRIRIPRAPDAVSNCNCSICRRYGALWAYYPSREVQVEAAPEATEGYAWGPRSIRFVRCATCGCVTHWEGLGRRAGGRMGVNARQFDPHVLGAVEVRCVDRAGDTGP